jgi:hypothetical protein
MLKVLLLAFALLSVSLQQSTSLDASLNITDGNTSQLPSTSPSPSSTRPTAGMSSGGLTTQPYAQPSDWSFLRGSTLG